MTHPTHPAAALEPIETASRDELQTLQLERLGSLRHAYDNVPHYRRTFDAAGVHPDDLKSLADLAKFRSRPSTICATTIRSGCSRCRASKSARARVERHDGQADGGRLHRA